MVDFVRKMTVNKSCRHGEYGSYEHLFFLFFLPFFPFFLFDPYEDHMDLCNELCLADLKLLGFF